ncbi:hypothetical protein SESBI_25528 [Sesbania bispinosa]|nr:hypothetical protein SESBI_25528 [Sesbania bispinosa]
MEEEQPPLMMVPQRHTEPRTTARLQRPSLAAKRKRWRTVGLDVVVPTTEEQDSCGLLSQRATANEMTELQRRMVARGGATVPQRETAAELSSSFVFSILSDLFFLSLFYFSALFYYFFFSVGVQLMKGRKGQGWNGGDGAAVAACAMGRLKIAMMLDDSAAVITLGDKVFLRLEQVMESCNKIGWL